MKPSLPPRLARTLFGHVQWDPPSWFRVAAEKLPVRSLLLFLALLLVAGGCFGAWRWHKARQRAPVAWTIQAPSVGVANPVPPLTINFQDSVARLDLAGKVLDRHVSIAPRLPGVWRWADDRTLQFVPSQMWPPGTRFTVKAGSSLFGPQAAMRSFQASFETEPLKAEARNFQFYLNPVDGVTKEITGSYLFNYPVRPEEVKVRLKLRQQGDEPLFDGRMADRDTFTVTVDAGNPRLVHVRSRPLSLPTRQQQFATVELEKGVPARDGVARTLSRLENEVRIPTMNSLFRIEEVSTHIVNGDDGNPQQILTLTSSIMLKPDEAAKAVEIWRLPSVRPATPYGNAVTNFPWSGPEQVTPEVLAQAVKLPVMPVASERDFEASVSFRLPVGENAGILVKVSPSLKSVGNYRLPEPFSAVRMTPPFPKQVSIMGEGAVLALGGERRLSIASRGVRVIEHEIARVDDRQINHLVTQTEGRFDSPTFRSWTFNEENLSAITHREEILNPAADAKPDYSSLPLAEYLRKSSGSNHGLFLLTVRGWDRTRAEGIAKARKHLDDPDVPDTDLSPVRQMLATDRRLILVTDLAPLVKANADGSREVFIQSFQSGNPVPGATVEVLAKNGTVLLSRVTGPNGQASLPSFRESLRDKEPVALVFRKAGDISFLPLGRPDRELNFSRFDIGGDETASPDALEVFLFSDRGLYRPGETARLGLVARQLDWKNSFAGLPLEIVASDPRGREVLARKVVLPESGLLEWEFPTLPASPTGTYHISVFLARNKMRSQVLGSTSLRVEEFLPDRLRLRTEIAAAGKRGWITPAEFRIHARLQNLHGSPSVDHRLNGRLQLIPCSFRFEAWPDHTFNDPLLSPGMNRQTVETDIREVRTDEKGEAILVPDFGGLDKAAFRADFLVRGFEKDGGRGVSSAGGAIVSELPFLVGVKSDGDLRFIRPGTVRSVNLVAVNPALDSIARSDLSVQWIERRHVSVLTKGPDGNYRYQSVLKEEVLEEAPLNLPAHGLNVPLKTRHPGEFVVRVTGPGNHILAAVFYSVAGTGELTRPLDRNAELHLKVPGRAFAPGETVEIQVVAPYAGAGLITLERERVYASSWFRSSTPSSIQRIRIPEDFEGNGYLTVTFTRALDSREIFASPLSSAVVPFTVNRDRRTARLEMRVPERIKPGQVLPIVVNTDRPAKAVVFAVDEGILQVARYRTPSPLDHFLRKRALQVSTFQIADMLLPEYSLLREVSSTGGDGGTEALSANLNPFKRRNKPPVAFWSGIIDIPAGGKTVDCPLPEDFDGTLRVMAVAVTPDRMGSAESQTFVTGDLVLSPNVPTFAAPGDEFDVTVTVANRMADSRGSAEVTLTAEAGEGLQVMGSNTVKVPIAHGRDAGCRFRVRATERLGEARLSFAARSGEATRTAVETLSVRPPVARRTTVEGGRSRTTGEIRLQRALHPEFQERTASVSVMPLGLADGLRAYLEQYPHLCSEQLVSRAMATVSLAALADFGLPREDIQKNVDRTVYHLRMRQNDQGAFGLWSMSDGAVTDFTSVHAMHFLMEAREAGFEVPDEVLRRGFQHLQAMAQDTPGSLSEARNQARAIYLLTRSGQVTSHSLARLRERLEKDRPGTWEKDIATAYMASTYSLLQNRREAARLVAKVPLSAIGRYTPEDDFDSALAHDGQLLYLLALHFPDRLKGLTDEELEKVLAPLHRQEFNTTSACFATLALSSMSRHLGDPGKTRLTVEAMDASGRTVFSKAKEGRFLSEAVPDVTASVRLGGEGASFRGFYWHVVQTGFDRNLPATAESSRIEVQRELTNAKGEPITSCRLGEEVTVTVRLRSTDGGEYANIALVDLLPAGFEINLDSLRASAGWDYKDAREDRLVIYATAEKGVRQFSYRIRATNVGRFIVPPAQASSMYRKDVSALSAASTFTVTAP